MWFFIHLTAFFILFSRAFVIDICIIVLRQFQVDIYTFNFAIAVTEGLRKEWITRTTGIINLSLK